MEAREYKLLQEHPAVFNRSELADTLRWLGDALPKVAHGLAQILDGSPLEKPLRHAGGAETDLFRVAMPRDEAEEVCGHLLSSEAAAVSPSGETTSRASQIASLLDHWSRYARSLDNGAA
jgi:hypothetical protein